MTIKEALAAVVSKYGAPDFTLTASEYVSQREHSYRSISVHCDQKCHQISVHSFSSGDGDSSDWKDLLEKVDRELPALILEMRVAREIEKRVREELAATPGDAP